jgi:hypothetical protein
VISEKKHVVNGLFLTKLHKVNFQPRPVLIREIFPVFPVPRNDFGRRVIPLHGWREVPGRLVVYPLFRSDFTDIGGIGKFIIILKPITKRLGDLRFREGCKHLVESLKAGCCILRGLAVQVEYLAALVDQGLKLADLRRRTGQ